MANTDPFCWAAELPLEFPDGTTPVTCRVSVYDSSTDKKVGVGSLMNRASAPPLPVGSLYMEEVQIKVSFFILDFLFLIDAMNVGRDFLHLLKIVFYYNLC